MAKVKECVRRFRAWWKPLICPYLKATQYSTNSCHAGEEWNQSDKVIDDVCTQAHAFTKCPRHIYQKKKDAAPYVAKFIIFSIWLLYLTNIFTILIAIDSPLVEEMVFSVSISVLFVILGIITAWKAT